MGLETVTNIADFIRTNPTGADPISQGDNHIQNIKIALTNDFAGFTGAVCITGIDGGVADAYTLTPSVALPAYGTKMLTVFAPTVNNTGACTMNVSGLGVKNLRSVSGAALVAGDLVLGNIYVAVYTGTEFRLTGITKNYADQLAFAAALPGQPGTAVTYYLKTFNGVASWALNGVARSARVANTVLGLADDATFVDITAGTFTQTFAAAATLGLGWYCWIRNSGTGDVTLDPNGAELIDNLASFIMYGQETRLVMCDGIGLYSVVVHPFYRKAISTFAFIMPPGYLEIEIDLTGGGGQGGSGRRGSAGSVRSGGGAGGAPSRVVRKLRNIIAGSSTTVTIGAGGTTGGAVVTVDNTSGNDGQAGGNTTFGALVTAFGGAAGKGGATGNVVTAGSGSISAGLSNNTGASVVGGLPSTSTIGGNGITVTGSQNNVGLGGAGANGTGAFGGHTEWGGASSQSDTTSTSVATGGSSLYGVSAAGPGGWITAADTLPATGGTAGLSGTYAGGGGAAGGTCGAAPTAGTNGTAAATDDVCGGAGGGGGATITAGQTGKAGGNGAAPGGPGGGGGAVLNGQNSGAGGAGADGRAIIKGVI